ARRVVVPDAEPGLVGFEMVPDFDESPAEPRGARLVGQADVAADPGGTGSGHLRDAPGSALVVPEVVELQLERRLEGAQRLRRCRRARHVEDAERIAREDGIAPGPVELAAVDGVLDAVAAEDPGILPVEIMTELLALGEKTSTGRAAEALRDDRSDDFQLQRLARLGSDLEAPEPEAVLG